MKLSNTQIKVLRILAEDGNYARFMPYRGSFNPTAYWFDNHHLTLIREATMQALLRAGMASRHQDTARITDVGRRMLIALDENEGGR